MKPLPNPRTGVPWGPIVSIITALLYGISPIDLIPDLIPLLGIVDDAVIVPLLLILGIAGVVKRAKRAHAAQVIDVRAKTP